MTAEPITPVEEWRRARRWRGALAILALSLLVGAAVAVLGIGGTLLLKLSGRDTVRYASAEEHFKYGSIGSEPASGVPYGIWKTLPSLYPEEFQGRRDYAAFGFLYEADAQGRPKDLPVGVSKREVNGVEVVWLNCAACHVGTWRGSPAEPRRIVAAMPSNNLDFEAFISLLLKASTDERLAPDQLFPAMKSAGVELGTLDRLIWRLGVLPRFREGLLGVRGRIQPLLDQQHPWGPGRVDTFNPYKLIQFGARTEQLAPEERLGVADFPAVFNQGPRQGMNLHWDGNNASLAERNLSAAIGAGVTEETADHAAISRVANWLEDLPAPGSPHRPDASAAARGRSIYARVCSSCHGRQEARGYVFEGDRLGQVEPISRLGVDRARLDSYTPWFREKQVTELFAGTPRRFRHFRKTDGYANLPLDGLWLRGPYLHNGSVPTLADLLKPPEQRPKAFLRGSDVIDPRNGGFVSPPCSPSAPPTRGFCFDTSLPGNGAGGHLYGVDLSPGEKTDLLAYLLTF